MALTAAILAGGVVAASAGSAAAGAAANRPGTPNFALSALPGADPLQAAASFDALVQLGLLDPNVLRAASPLNQALSTFRQDPQKLKSQRNVMLEIGELRALLDRGDEAALARALTPGSSIYVALQAIAGVSGLSVEALVRSEREFNARVGPIIAQAEISSADTFQGRQTAIRNLAM